MGVIKPRQNVHVTVEVVPTKVGFFDDVRLPLFVYGSDKVTLVQFVCAVEGVAINVHFPLRDGDREVIVWPRTVRKVSEEMVLKCLGECEVSKAGKMKTV